MVNTIFWDKCKQNLLLNETYLHYVHWRVICSPWKPILTVQLEEFTQPPSLISLTILPNDIPRIYSTSFISALSTSWLLLWLFSALQLSDLFCCPGGLTSSFTFSSAWPTWLLLSCNYTLKQSCFTAELFWAALLGFCLACKLFVQIILHKCSHGSCSICHTWLQLLEVGEVLG